MGQEAARITPYDDSQVKVEFPYKKEVVAEIKKEVPWPGYKWNAGEKCWLIQNDFADYAVDILHNAFGKVDVHPEVMDRIKTMRGHQEAR